MSPDDAGSDRYLILLEQIQSQVQLLAEGHDVLNQKIDRVDSRLQRLSDKVDVVEARLSAKIDGVERRLDRRIAVLERPDPTLSH